MKNSDEPASAYRRLTVALLAGIVAGFLTLLFGSAKVVPLAAWDSAALTYIVWAWATIWSLDAARTNRLARREDPGRSLSDILLTVASLASLAAVGLILVQASSAEGLEKGLFAGFGVISVIISWAVVHTLYTLKYAEIYYRGASGGVDFNQSKAPRYSDFAYLSFTVGMTFQVSDTDVKTTEMRKAILHQAHLSYLFGAIIIATTINLIAGLSK